MARQQPLGGMIASGPILFCAALCFLFLNALCCLSGTMRLIMAIAALVLLLAGLLAWRWPRYERGLMIAAHLLILLIFGLLLWRFGPSFVAFGCIGAAALGFIWSAFIYKGKEDAEEENENRPAKIKRIAELLETDDEDALLSVVFRRIVRRYGSHTNVMNLKEHERVFLLVEHARGLIGNGGFNYLFEQNLRGDPHFIETAAAFEAIGCAAAAEAFRKAFRLFPNERPPEALDERLRIYRSGSGKIRGTIDRQFFQADDDIQRCLVSWVRTHGEEFTELDRLPPRRKRTKRKRRRQPADESEGPTAGQLVASLPHWARVAFAARCGRRVWPLFVANWPNASVKNTEAVKHALELAERSAALAQSAEGLKEAAGNALQTAGAALFALYGFDVKDDEEEEEPLPPDGNAAVYASGAAKTAEKAAETANSSPDKSTELALEAFGFARQAAGDAPEIVDTLWRELTQLERVARRGRWTDETPVPPSVWELLD